MKGMDVSNHNGSINWNKVKSSDIKVVYIKASEGTTYQDPYLNQHYQGAKSIGLPTGFYHYLKGTSAPESQAENFWSLIKDKENNLIPCIDIEENNFNVMDYTLRFIAKFKELSSLPILIYTGPYFANDNLNNKLATYPCWIAHYGVNSPMATNIWGINYAGHQYTEKGEVPGINGNVDLNNFTESILIKGHINQDTAANNSVNDVEDLGRNDIYSILQRELNKQGFRDKNGNKLRVDGEPGELTLSACPLVKRGAEGEITRWIQLRVGAKPDGDFGEETENCVIWMQNKWGIALDGRVGQNTWKKLLGL